MKILKISPINEANYLATPVLVYRLVEFVERWTLVMNHRYVMPAHPIATNKVQKERNKVQEKASCMADPLRRIE